MGDYTPIFLSDIPRLFASGQLPLDVALIQVTPPDGRGMCSLGVSVDIVKSAAAQRGPGHRPGESAMPRTLGDTFLHVYDSTSSCPWTCPLIEVGPVQADETHPRASENTSPPWSTTARPSSSASGGFPRPSSSF